MKKRYGLVILSAMLALIWLSGCATMEASKKVPYRWTSEGTVIWEDEFEFKPPPPDWKLVQVESGGEFSFGFLKVESGSFPSQSMFVYDEDPFGVSTRLEIREQEFFERFLWSACLQMQVLEKKQIKVPGGEGLSVMVEGKDPVKKEKAKSKVVFGKRGEHVVSFYITQWRPMDGTYDDSGFEVFDKFVSSFKYLKKSFYETL
jgi:hypothetical protein